MSRVCRSLLRRPLFTVMVLLTLSLGVGASATIFSVVHALLLRPMPFEDPDRLLMLMGAQPKRGVIRLGVSYPDFQDWKGATDVLSDLAAVSNTRSVTLTGVGRPEHLNSEIVSGNFFELLGVEAEIGRVFSKDHDVTPGGHPVTVISHSLWQNRFDGDPDIVGRQVLLNDHSFTVIGVLPKFYRGTWWDRVDLWTPMMMASILETPDYLEDRSIHWHTVMARMRPGVTPEQTETALNRIAEELEVRYPSSNEGYRVYLEPLLVTYYDYVKGDLWKALGASAFLLLLCCINISSLLLTRGRERQRDLAVRSALGASRRHLVIEHLGESLILAFVGGGLGMILASLGTGWLVRQSTIPSMNFDERYLDLSVVGLLFAAVAVCGVLFGLGPTLQTLWTDLWRYLRQGTRSSRRGRFRSVLNGLAVVELALALVLLVGAGLALQRFFELRSADLGFPMEGLLTQRLDLGGERYESDEILRGFADRLVSELESISGIEGAALVGPYAPPDARLAANVIFEDLPGGEDGDSGIRLFRQYVTPGYFRVMGIELEEGRGFSPQDSAESPPVAVVARVVTEKVWPESSGVGRRLRRGLADSTDFPWREVVGVVETIKSRGPKDWGRGPDYDLYIPFHQDPTRSPTLMVRFAPGLALSATAVRDVVHRIDPEIPVYDAMTMEERVAALALDERFTGLLMAIFAGIAMIVAAVGVFGILSYGVRRRTQEIGVRVALGATSRQVLHLVLRQGYAQLLAGLILGAGLLWLLQSREMLPSELDSRSAIILTLAVGFLLAVSSVAILLPAWRATHVVPTEALRDE